MRHKLENAKDETLETIPSLKLRHKSPLKIGLPPKMIGSSPNHPCLQVRWLLLSGSVEIWYLCCSQPWRGFGPNFVSKNKSKQLKGYVLHKIVMKLKDSQKSWAKLIQTLEDERLEPENDKMMVWFRWFSFSIGWFLGSMLFFRGVTW